MVATSTTAATYSTAGTVSSPLDLDAVRGEYSAVSLENGNGDGTGIGGANGTGKRRTVRPKPKVTLTSLTVNNSGTLRKLNSVVIPIVYSEKFYKDVLDPSLDDINKLIYYADIPVGACCCRFENLASSSKEKPPTLVILTLAVLAPYRSQGLGRALLLNALRSALHPTAPPPLLPPDGKGKGGITVVARKAVTRAMAHVQVGNEDAKRFYERLGFKATETIDDYYSKMEPRGAVLMVCDDIASALGEAPNGSA
ncbi:hypothetical protein EHS25_009711 [Saitozyma podzolica]|uniref:N-acetyltransferase domain-containing protein n=1 Tax=Saitozyma podzolica TaxID=1890683 RepID=A0A427YJZ0_9TREE|nr:hypothetical protein EHS25_009711 [Saitozyma podzolica]